VHEASATRDYLLALAAMERALGRPVPLKQVQMRAEQPGIGNRESGITAGEIR
jgi:hypothetical protein